MSQPQTNLFWPPNTPNVYGPLVSLGHIRRAAVATLQKWLPSYINELTVRYNPEPKLLPVQSWKVLPEYRALPARESPAVMVTCPGTLSQPERQGDGTYSTHVSVQVSVVVWGGDWEPTEDTTSLYGIAVIAALTQHPDLGRVSAGVKWLSYRYSRADHSSTRTLGVAQIAFDVEVAALVNSNLGPVQPEDGPISLPLVESVHVTIDKEPLT